MKCNLYLQWHLQLQCNCRSRVYTYQNHDWCSCHPLLSCLIQKCIQVAGNKNSYSFLFCVFLISQSKRAVQERQWHNVIIHIPSTNQNHKMFHVYISKHWERFGDIFINVLVPMVKLHKLDPNLTGPLGCQRFYDYAKHKIVKETHQKLLFVTIICFHFWIHFQKIMNSQSDRNIIHNIYNRNWFTIIQ